MTRWWMLAAAIALVLLLLFAAATAADIDILADPTPLLSGARWAAGLAGVTLLVADVFLPVPASLVMIAHGTLFGTFFGAILSVIGSVASALAAFAVGRAGTPAIRRLVTEAEHERASRLLGRWGLVAIAATRPVPILAETVAILAGSSHLRWYQTAIAAALGSVVPSAAYAWAGAHATGIVNHALVFAGVILVSSALWLIGRRSV